ncbi:MAG: manganese efflux pump MntP family protein [Acidobacteria bacterium]|jgi:putative Mn2+ efflux pump MntP|nr:manganese efflux pump MntP family protein [Acidobacteriota bacterium]
MSFFEILLLSLALAADAFSVGAALGLRHHEPRQVFRVVFHFGLFQTLLALLGALLGGRLLVYVESLDHWIAFALLALVGSRMIWSGLREASERPVAVDLTRGWSLVGLSLAVSIDALAAGTTLPATRAPIALAVATIGIVAGLAALVAMRFAGWIARRIGSRAEIAAGIVLIGLGVKIVLEHTGLLPLT